MCSTKFSSIDILLNMTFTDKRVANYYIQTNITKVINMLEQNLATAVATDYNNKGKINFREVNSVNRPRKV